MSRQLAKTKLGFEQQLLGLTDLVVDAWGRQKFIEDYSVFRGLFTYDIPASQWKEYQAGVEQSTFSNAIVTDGGLDLTSTTGITTQLVSKRHPRYQPNKGHLYSTAVWLPTESEASTVRDWGLGSAAMGNYVCFRFTNDKLYAVVARDGVETVQQITEHADGWVNFDYTKGHLYDIQMQWRGVGNYLFYVDQELVAEIENLGRLGEGELPTLTIPALPVLWSVTGNARLRAGCVDVASEGGGGNNTIYRSTTTGMALINISNTYSDGMATLAIRVPPTFNGIYSARDALLNRITTFCRDQAVTGVWLTRDATVLGGISANVNPLLGWAPVSGDSNLQYMKGGTGTTLTTTFETNHSSANSSLLVAKRVPLDTPDILDNPGAKSDFYLTNGDYIIVTILPDGANKTAGTTIEWSEEV